MTKNYIHDVDVAWVIRDSEMKATEQAPAMWVLAHRGYSGNGALDLWGYPSETAALKAGAQMAADMTDGDNEIQRLVDAGQYREAMTRYESQSPGSHLLRVEPALLVQEAT